MNSANTCRLPTRKSPLALRQTEIVAGLVQDLIGMDVQIIPMTTTGDERMDWSLQEQGGKGLFTKELEQAILDGRADIAVHSAKDMPTEDPDGLEISAFLKREDPRDVLVTRENTTSIQKLASGSPRRISQLKNRFPAVEWLELRGNVETRLKKIAKNEEADGTILARAGLNRLKIDQFPGLHFESLEVDKMIPAPGQAAIAVQTRASESEKFSVLGDQATEKCVRFERKVLERMGGGCQVAIGVHLSNDTLYFFHEKTGIVVKEFHSQSEDVLIQELLASIQ
ncbi:MAG: hydroxymethylbilane synthase [Verrucomicrobiota bacterium]|nr:hydroxymethylbilane synthase [Verrucomicrobiota bacterium]